MNSALTLRKVCQMAVVELSTGFRHCEFVDVYDIKLGDRTVVKVHLQVLL